MFQVLQRVQRQVQEVARPAGRVQYPEVRQPLQELAQLPGGSLPPIARRLRCLGLFRLVKQLFQFFLADLPLGQPRAHDHRIHDLHDLVAVGVVRAQL